MAAAGLHDDAAGVASGLTGPGRRTSRSWWVLVGGCLVAAIVVLAVEWFLPWCFVDARDLSPAEKQAAYNAARVPIGVAVAAVLAAAAAGAGVLINHRNVEVARQGLYGMERRHTTDLQHERARADDERFTRGVELLGHEAAGVCVGAMHALHRLAKTDLERTQTILDVLCAYLRQPFHHPDFDRDPNAGGCVDDLSQGRPSWWPSQQADRDTRDAEREVRRTAMILAIDLLPPAGDIAGRRLSAPLLGLNGAALDDFDAHGRALHLQARKAHFAGFANLNKTCFVDQTDLDMAYFAGPTTFNDARFTGVVDLSGARFASIAQFKDTHFASHANLCSMHFAGQADFEGTSFAKFSSFRGTHFAASADLRLNPPMNGSLRPLDGATCVDPASLRLAVEAGSRQLPGGKYELLSPSSSSTKS